MKIDFSQPITDLDGKPIADLTLRTVAINSLLAQFPDEMQLPGEKKMERFAVSTRINCGGEVDVTPEEVSLMKMLIGKAYGPLVVGRAYEILNG